MTEHPNLEYIVGTMNIFSLILGILFTLISTATLSYISIATMVGPWMAPTLVLLGRILFKLRPNSLSPDKVKQELIFTQAVGSVGGTIATGIGFTLPMLYFLDKQILNSWLASPVQFCLFIALCCLAAGSFGIMLGRFFIKPMIKEEKLSFPVSQLTYSVVDSDSSSGQAKSLGWGIAGTTLLCIARDGIFALKGFIPKTIDLFPSLFGNVFSFSIWPTLWSIGFTAGLGVAVPLLVGIISRYYVLHPLNNHAHYFSVNLFPPFEFITFTTAFCSGLVLTDFVAGLAKNPAIIANRFKLYVSNIAHVAGLALTSIKKALGLVSRQPRVANDPVLKKISLFHLETVVALTGSIALLWYLEFSFLAQVVFLLSTVIATYEICFIGGEIGLIQFGRFATFVLIPMLLLFKPNPIQITVICMFFSICAATASDYLFDYKSGQLAGSNQRRLHGAQWLGLLVTALSVGAILYLLFTKLGIGSQDLFAHRGRTKALLIQTLNFNPYVVGMGFLYGLFLRQIRVNPTMTLGGIIMPNHISFGLILGGLCTKFVKNKQRYMPFCAGVFACESLWVLISLILKMF